MIAAIRLSQVPFFVLLDLRTAAPEEGESTTPRRLAPIGTVFKGLDCCAYYGSPIPI